MTTLYDLKKDEEAIICALHSDGKMKRRLIDMGVTPGTKIKLCRRAPLGDPLEFLIMGYNLSIRAEEAKKIDIERVGK